MRAGADRIFTTHVGALPMPTATFSAHQVDDAQLDAAVSQVVSLQRMTGIDVVNEGERTKGGNWVTFINQRLTGFEARQTGGAARLLAGSADWQAFADYYRDAREGGTLFESTRAAPNQVRTHDWDCIGPIGYCGQADLQREIDALKRAASAQGLSPGQCFLTTTAPASIEAGRRNEHYASQEAFVEAIAEAMRCEYEAIAAAGFLVQVDDAWLAALWDRIGIPMGLPAYQRYCAQRIEALNHALRNIPREQVRYHLCWGSWHGPHAHDIPMADMVQLLLSIKAGTYLFEAANVRHEHEYVVWQDVTLPDDRLLAPGVVSHATTLVEHPELVALRIRRFADLVGRERVIASTDCGLGLRCHPQVAWAKLKALADGAALASRRLWA